MLEGMIKNGIATGFGDEWIRLGATSEHTCHGSFSERTMALSVPYAGVETPYHGNLTTTQDDLNAGSSGCTGPASRSTATPTGMSPSIWRSRRSSGHSGCFRSPPTAPPRSTWLVCPCKRRRGGRRRLAYSVGY
jgi:hypothetical protein